MCTTANLVKMARPWHGHCFLGIRPGCPLQTADVYDLRMSRPRGLRYQAWPQNMPRDKLHLIHAIDTTDCLCSGARLGPSSHGFICTNLSSHACHMGQKALYNLRDINRARTVQCLTFVTRSLTPSPLHRVLRYPKRICEGSHVEWRVHSADRCEH